MVQRNGTRFDSQEFSIERTGSRKYSVPRLASARGEEAARRAMPTSSAAGFELQVGSGVGVEAAQAISEPPWQAAEGNRVRLVCFKRFDRIVEDAGAAGSVGNVAIVTSPHGRDSIRFLFAMSRNILLFLRL